MCAPYRVVRTGPACSICCKPCHRRVEASSVGLCRRWRRTCWTLLMIATLKITMSKWQHCKFNNRRLLFSERELMFMFAICRRPSVCLSVVCLSSVTFVHPTQPIEIFGNVSAPCNRMVTWQHPGEILRRSSQGNPSVGGLNQRVVEKFSDVGPLRGYISKTVQDRR